MFHYELKMTSASALVAEILEDEVVDFVSFVLFLAVALNNHNCMCAPIQLCCTMYKYDSSKKIGSSSCALYW